MNQTAELTYVNAGEIGNAVAAAGNNVVTGAPISTVGTNQLQGAAFGFVQPSGGWKSSSHPNAELTSSDGAPTDYFGDAVGASGSLVIVGAPDHTVNGNVDQGAAYIFGPKQ